MSFLGSRPWREIPFRRRGKTEFDCVIDTLLLVYIQQETGALSDIEPKQYQRVGKKSGSGPRELKSSDQSQLTNPERIVRILANLRELVLACKVDAGPKCQESISKAILSDSKHLMNQPCLPFNVGLQVTAAVNLVARYALDSVQKQEAETLCADWRSRVALT